MVGAGIGSPKSSCSQDGVGMWDPQSLVGKGAFVHTLDGAWEKWRQVGPAWVGPQPVAAHSSLEVGTPAIFVGCLLPTVCPSPV